MSQSSISAHSLIKSHRAKTKKQQYVVFVLLLLAILAWIGDVCSGPAGFSVGEIWSAILYPSSSPAALDAVIWQIRLPAALMAVLVGASLSLAGAEMQTILDNPLASPFTLGISSAAAFGASMAIVMGVGLPFMPTQFLVVGNAFLFAFASMLFLHLLTRGHASDPASLVLFGIALVFTFNALTALVQLVASPDSLQQLAFWSMGSLAEAGWQPILVLGCVVAVVLPFTLKSAWTMTALRFGTERAQSLGVDVGRLRMFSLLRVSLLAATAVAFVGTIGFVGLVGPHIARLLVGEDHRFYLPTSLLTGAFVMSFASLLSKMLVPGVLLPVGIVTSLVGLPIFVVLVHRNRSINR